MTLIHQLDNFPWCTTRKCTTYGKGIISFRFAGNIFVGDEVLVETNNKLTPVKVIDVSTLVMEGEHNVF